MKSQKFLHVRIPHDFHQQLVKYAEDRFVPVSSVVLQAVAQTIGYKPKPSTSRSTDASPVEPEYGDINPDEYDWDMEDLQRRAAAAPLKGV
jgi:hypothetical protein